jgi:tRNA G18 (ribose-2'-O)-methylase SpoU
MLAGCVGRHFSIGNLANQNLRFHEPNTYLTPTKRSTRIASNASNILPSLRRRYCSKRRLKTGKEVCPKGGVYILDHNKDPMADHLRKARSIRGRRENGEFLIEERPFIMQALMANVPMKQIFISESAYAKQQEIEADPEQFAMHPTIGSLPLDEFGQGEVPIYILADSFISKLYPVDTPSMLAMAPLLHSKYQTIESFSSMKRILVLDNVLNPRNIGMILRNAEAFAVDGIFLLTGPNATDLGNTQDILYSRLSISASRGAAFRVPFLHVKKDDFLSFASEHRFDLICTSPHGENAGIPEWKPPIKKLSTSKLKSKSKKAAKSTKATTTKELTPEDKPSYKGQMIIIGNESEGVRPEILKHATSLLTIPTAVESLNAAVACGIVLFRLANSDVKIRTGSSEPFISKHDDKSL